MPKCPRSSGPVRNELGCCTTVMPCSRVLRPCALSAMRAARTKARILSGSFSPGARSTPDDTSTAGARVIRSASATLPASSPPDSMNGTPRSRFSSRRPVERLAEPAGPRRLARRAARRTAASRRPSHRGGSATRSARVSIGSAFITGRPKRARTAATRSGVSLPCSCSMSGLSASTTRSSSASVASTESATFLARPCTRSPSARAASIAEVARRRREEHEADHVGAGVERRVERVGGFQAADFDQKSHDGRGSSASSAHNPTGS